MLEVNTRYLYVEQLFDVDELTDFVNLKKSQKTTLNIIKAIEKIEKKIEKIGGNPIRILRFDGESAIKSLVKANDKQIFTIKERIGNQYKLKEMNQKYLFSRYLLLKV